VYFDLLHGWKVAVEQCLLDSATAARRLSLWLPKCCWECAALYWLPKWKGFMENSKRPQQSKS